MTNSDKQSAPPQQLKREIGVFNAMMLGLGSIIGTGVFIFIAVGVQTTGPAVILAIAIAAIVATCNGLSSAQLAAAHPVAGGTYEYGHKYLNPTIGFAAGWLFLLAKSASAATAALGFSYYLQNMLGDSFLPISHVTLGLIILLILTIIVLTGLRRTSLVNTVIVTITIIALLSFIFGGLSKALENGTSTLTPFFKASKGQTPMFGFLETVALMFVAYTGYGRIATLGEEIHDPKKNIPIAIILTLIVSMVLYITIAWVGVAAVGDTGFGGAVEKGQAPLVKAAAELNVPYLGTILGIGAITAMLGVLLNLILGLSRVLLAMGRRGDMPKATANLNESGTTPTVSVIVMAIVIALLITINDIKIILSFSAFTVLVYYALTNLAALKLPSQDRLYPRIFAWGGLLSCIFLAFMIDSKVMASGIACLAIGYIFRAIFRTINKSTT